MMTPIVTMMQFNCMYRMRPSLSPMTVCVLFASKLVSINHGGRTRPAYSALWQVSGCKKPVYYYTENPPYCLSSNINSNDSSRQTRRRIAHIIHPALMSNRSGRYTSIKSEEKRPNSRKYGKAECVQCLSHRCVGVYGQLEERREKFIGPNRYGFNLSAKEMYRARGMQTADDERFIL